MTSEHGNRLFAVRGYGNERAPSICFFSELGFQRSLYLGKVRTSFKYVNDFTFVAGHFALQFVLNVEGTECGFTNAFHFVQTSVVCILVQGYRQRFGVFHLRVHIEYAKALYAAKDTNGDCRRQNHRYDNGKDGGLFRCFLQDITHRRHPPLQSGNIYIYSCLRTGKCS